MKFKELPEGYYFIHRISDVVSVEKVESPENWPKYVIELETIQVVHDGRSYNKKGNHTIKAIDDLQVDFTPSDEIRAEEHRRRKSYGGKLSHVTRKLNQKEPLEGKALETALKLVTCDDPKASINKDPFYIGIAKKLTDGVPLSDYEHHILVDVNMVHSRF